MTVRTSAGGWLDPAAIIPRVGSTRTLATKLERQALIGVHRAEPFTVARFRDACTQLLDRPEANHPSIQPILTREDLAIRRNRTAVLANPGLPLQFRISTAQQMGTHWRFRLDVSEPAVPDSIVESWICQPFDPFWFPLSQMHDLLAGRPALLPTAVKAGGRAAAGAAASLHLTPDMSETLLAAASSGTGAGRAALRELAVNPQLPTPVREEALTRVVRHWTAARRAEAWAALKASVMRPSGPHPDMSQMTADEASILLVWASGQASSRLGQAQEDVQKPAVLTEVTYGAKGTQRMPSGGHLFPDVPYWRSSGLPHRAMDLPMWNLPAAVAGWDNTGLIAAACTAGLPADQPWVCRSVASAAGHYVRRRLGTDAAAWETFAALRTEWCGNVEELLAASLTL